MSYDTSKLVTLGQMQSLGEQVHTNLVSIDSKVNVFAGIYPVKGTQVSTTGAWTGSLAVDTLFDGMTIAYYLPYGSSGDVTLELTLTAATPPTTTTGRIKVYMTGNIRMNTQYQAGSTLLLTYWSAGSISIEGTATTEARWTCFEYNTTYSPADTSTSVEAADTITQGTATTYARSDHAHNFPTSGATAGTYGATADVTGTEGTTIKIPKITVDKYGRITSVAEYTLTNKDTVPTYNANTETITF